MLPFFALLIAPAVDLENRVARLPDLVAELAAKGNANLSSSKELVTIRSQPRPLDAWLPLIIDLPPFETSSLPLAELPPDFRRRIETWIETFRKQRSTTKTQPAVPPPV